MNKVILIGRVGEDPEARMVNESKMATFSFVTSEKYTDKSGQKHESTDWHRIVMWRNIAELCEKYVHKGDKLMIEGSVKYRSYDNKDGVKVYVTEILADKMEFLGGRQIDQNQTQNIPPQTEQSPSYDETNDLPFN